MPQPKPTGPRYLGMDERIFIADGPVCGLSMSAIASRLGRSRSTVCREVARNRDRGTGRYTPYRAGEMVAARRRRPKPRKLEDRRLAAAVQAKLDAHWSPEQISHWLAAEYPDNEGMNASTETIYQAIYIQAKGQFKRDISQQLRSGRTARRPRTAPDARKPRFREPMVDLLHFFRQFREGLRNHSRKARLWQTPTIPGSSRRSSGGRSCSSTSQASPGAS